MNYRAPHCRPLAGFQAASSRQGRGGERNRKRKREGDSVPHFFLTTLTTAQQCIVAATYTVARLIALQLVCSSISVAIMQIDSDFFDNS